MYRLVYNYRETTMGKNGKRDVVIEREYNFGDEFRLKKDAVHYLCKEIQNEYKETGYATEQISGVALKCIKTDITDEKKRVVIEWKISVKKL